MFKCKKKSKKKIILYNSWKNKTQLLMLREKVYQCAYYTILNVCTHVCEKKRQLCIVKILGLSCPIILYLCIKKKVCNHMK